MVVSGGEDFQSPVAFIGESEDYVPRDEMGHVIEKADNAGTMILWEAFRSKSLQQMCMIQEEGAEYLDSHTRARSILRHGEFHDGTHIMNMAREEPSPLYSDE